MSELGRHTIHKGHIHHGWNNAFEPRLRIAPGETVNFETLDASSGQLTRTSTAADLEKLDLARVNPVTGPVYIDGAKPGDALKITVLSLRPSGWGWTGNIPGFGLLADQFPKAHLHHWNYDPGLKPAKIVMPEGMAQDVPRRLEAVFHRDHCALTHPLRVMQVSTMRSNTRSAPPPRMSLRSMRPAMAAAAP